MQRYITTWRKPFPDNLDFEYYVSDDLNEVATVVKNIKARGVFQYNTYSLGESIEEYSSQNTS